MDEKIIVKSKIKMPKFLFIPIYGAGTFFSLAFFFGSFASFSRFNLSVEQIIAIILPISIAIILSKIIKSFISKISITVTDKRVFGCTLFGKRVDLPLDSVSAISVGALSSIAVATSSGAIKFAFIKNADEIHKILSDLLIARQNEKKISAPEIKQAAAPSLSQEIKELKQLLDDGIITQEEFEQKKKQYLNL